MGEETKIEWTDKTWNPWVGCQKVSPGCAHCYAESWADRFGRKFTDRTRTKDWRAPLKWDRQFVEAVRFFEEEDIGPQPTRPKVFPSLCDWLDDKVPIEWIADFLRLIYETPHLDWLLLTKRPENWFDRIRLARNFYLSRNADVALWIANWLPKAESSGMPARAGVSPPNVWFGVSCEDQQRADERIPLLLQIPAAVRWVSLEPLLGAIDLRKYLSEDYENENARRDGLSSGVVRRIRSEDGRHDLEEGQSPGKQMDRRIQGDSVRAEAGRKQNGTIRLSSSEADDSGEEILRRRAQTGDETSERTDSPRDGGQSHQRKQTGQSAIESGTGKRITESTPCSSSAQDTSSRNAMGREQSAIEIENGASAEDHRKAIIGRKAGGDSERFRSDVPNDKQNRSWRPALSWLVVGGESGKQARQCDVECIRSIVKQGKSAGVPVFVKQIGSEPTSDRITAMNYQWLQYVHHPKGGDPSEWLEDLRVREWPKGKA